MGMPPVMHYQGQQQPEKPSKRRTVGIPVLAGVVGMLIGSGAGAAGAQSELGELRAAEQTLTVEQESAEADLDMAEQLRAEQAKYADTYRRELGKLQKEHTALAEQFRLLEEQHAALSEHSTGLETQLAEARSYQPPAEPAPAAPAPFAAAPAAPTNVHYANCAAARAAGAAPVWIGDPGYGPHLDRDGDGVGCE